MSRNQNTFGSLGSTGKKLDVISEYISMYQNALKNFNFQTTYIDAFAGTGEIPLELKEDLLFDDVIDDFMEGSTARALSINPPFQKYIFIEKSLQKVDELKSKYENHILKDRILYSQGDANEKVASICKRTNWKNNRAVLFLDPYGSQVEWNTIEEIAKTKAIDLWYLFPAGASAFRQVSKKGTVHHTHEKAISRIYGTDEWKTAFLKPTTQTDLFGDQGKMEKVVTPESAAQFMIDRMKNIFEGGVLETLIPLGQHGYPSFYLIFAWANPHPKAKALARKLSKAAIRASDNKDGRPIRN